MPERRPALNSSRAVVGARRREGVVSMMLKAVASRAAGVVDDARRYSIVPRRLLGVGSGS